MTYLAAAWNTNNMANLKHVTAGRCPRSCCWACTTRRSTSSSKSCALRKDGNGDYLCTFTHDYPKWISAKDRRATGGQASSSQRRRPASAGTCSRTKAAADPAWQMADDVATPGGQPEVAKSPFESVA